MKVPEGTVIVVPVVSPAKPPKKRVKTQKEDATQRPHSWLGTSPYDWLRVSLEEKVNPQETRGVTIVGEEPNQESPELHQDDRAVPVLQDAPQP